MCIRKGCLEDVFRILKILYSLTVIPQNYFLCVPSKFKGGRVEALIVTY